MIQPIDFIDQFDRSGVTLFTGVPDSLMQGFCDLVQHHENHCAVANEAAAVSMCIGHYLSTGTPGVAYMQNSGLGNAHNPLVSLASRAVYSVPMILVIGWRGETEDEPQHCHQGRITLEHLELLNIPVVSADSAYTAALLHNGPVAVLVRKGEIAPLPAETVIYTGKTRQAMIWRLLEKIPTDSPIVSTTGKTSRELEAADPTQPVFLTVGGMGCANMIAQGIAKNIDRTVFVFDGDGAIQMHMGNMLSVCSENIVHILFNNGCHQSVGGQPITSAKFDFVAHALACGYATATKLEDVDCLMDIAQSPGPHFIEISVNSYSDPHLSRPKLSPKENLKQFMSWL